jgi:hypothetical protein
MKCYLRLSSDALADAQPHHSISAAKYAFLRVARELKRFDQQIQAAIHIAADKDSLVEYPDLILALGKHGGLQVQKT